MPRKWTDDEESVLLRCVQDNGQQGLADASEQLGRSVHSCRLYYHKQADAGRWPKMEVPHRYDAERAARFEAMVQAGATAAELAKAFGVSVSAAEKRATHVRAATVTPDWTPSTEDSVEAVWSRAEAQTARDVEKHSKRRFATVDFPDDGLPVGIFFTPDQHIRLSGPIQMTRMREDAELTRDTPGLYALLMGDGIDNHIVISQAMVRGGTKPSEEWRLFDHYLRMFGEPGASKILAVVSGNHDAWTIDKAGVDVLGMLVKNQQLHYSPDEVVLTCKVGPQTYVIKARHRYSRYGSTFNPSHKTKRMLEMGEDDFDIGAIAHDHEPNVEVFWRMGRRRVSIRTGAYQFSGSYAEAHGFTRFPVGCPAVLLFPNEKRFTPYDSVWEAAEVLRLYRTRKAA